MPLASVEVLTKDGTYRALARQEYNYWLDESGFGSGPYTLRITDTSGAVLVKDAIPTLTTTPLTSSQTSAVGAQIASCQ